MWYRTRLVVYLGWWRCAGCEVFQARPAHCLRRHRSTTRTVVGQGEPSWGIPLACQQYRSCCSLARVTASELLSWMVAVQQPPSVHSVTSQLMQSIHGATNHRAPLFQHHLLITLIFSIGFKVIGYRHR
jgi:hypothetical protein